MQLRNNVSLLVRLWVEIWIIILNPTKFLSASSWGCELKYITNTIYRIKNSQPPREAVSWNTYGIRRCSPTRSQPPREAVSWNRINVRKKFTVSRQPPREAVSWNLKNVGLGNVTSVSLLVRLWVEIFRSRLCWSLCRSSASSWGCELKFFLDLFWVSRIKCQPPREAVSWNDWEVEIWVVKMCQPPREAVSWNKNVAISSEVANVSLLVRLWVEMILNTLWSARNLVSLLVRLWVEMDYR